MPEMVMTVIRNCGHMEDRKLIGSDVRDPGLVMEYEERMNAEKCRLCREEDAE